MELTTKDIKKFISENEFNKEEVYYYLERLDFKSCNKEKSVDSQTYIKNGIKHHLVIKLLLKFSLSDSEKRFLLTNFKKVSEGNITLDDNRTAIRTILEVNKNIFYEVIWGKDNFDCFNSIEECQPKRVKKLNIVEYVRV